MRHVWDTREVHTGFSGRPDGQRNNLEDLEVDGRIILQWIFKKWDGEGIGLIWLGTETSGRPL